MSSNVVTFPFMGEVAITHNEDGSFRCFELQREGGILTYKEGEFYFEDSDNVINEIVGERGARDMCEELELETTTDPTGRYIHLTAEDTGDQLLFKDGKLESATIAEIDEDVDLRGLSLVGAIEKIGAIILGELDN